MIKLPDFNKAFFYENSFYLTCVNQRLSKTLALYELFKRTLDIPGTIMECGVFRGATLIRLATFRDLFSDPQAKKVIGFDTFDGYPEATLPVDKQARDNFIEEAGKSAISKKQLLGIFASKGIANVELIEGDIVKTAPQYAARHPSLKISFLYMDCTIYEPTFIALKSFYKSIVSGGLLVLNGYGKEGVSGGGETKAVDDFFGKSSIHFRRLPFSFSPCYLIKGAELFIPLSMSNSEEGN